MLICSPRANSFSSCSTKRKAIGWLFSSCRFWGTESKYLCKLMHEGENNENAITLHNANYTFVIRLNISSQFSYKYPTSLMWFIVLCYWVLTTDFHNFLPSNAWYKSKTKDYCSGNSFNVLASHTTLHHHGISIRILPQGLFVEYFFFFFGQSGFGLIIEPVLKQKEIGKKGDSHGGCQACLFSLQTCQHLRVNEPIAESPNSRWFIFSLSWLSPTRYDHKHDGLQ